MDNRDQGQSLNDFAIALCADSLWEPLGKVERKFVQSMLLGINRSRSVNLTEIAKGLEENIKLHATHKRLSRNLYDVELTHNLSKRLLKLGGSRVGENTRLIVHVYELKKKFAQKIEYLPELDEASETGFKVCEVLASEPNSKTYFPLLAHVWSDQVPGYVSDAEEVFKSIREVMTGTNGRGFIFLDSRSIGQEGCAMILSDRNLNYTVLLEDKSLKVRFQKLDYSIEEMLDRVDTRYGKILYKLVPVGVLGSSEADMDLFLHTGSATVKMPLSGRSVNFVVLKTNNVLVKEHSTPLLTTKTNLRSRKALMGLVDSFLSMQDIISMHKAVRDSYNPEDFRVLTFNRLQLLLTLLESVIYFDASTKGDEITVDEIFTQSPHKGHMRRTYLLPDRA